MDVLIIISTLFAILDTTKKARVTYIKSLNRCSFGLHKLPAFIQQSWLSFAASLFTGRVSGWLTGLRHVQRHEPCTGRLGPLQHPTCSHQSRKQNRRLSLLPTVCPTKMTDGSKQHMNGHKVVSQEQESETTRNFSTMKKKFVYCYFFPGDPVVAQKCMKQTEACLLVPFAWLFKLQYHSTCGSRAG